jgi:hypothetical protein
MDLIQGQPKKMETTGFETDELRNRTIYRRAVEVAIWGMPIVAADAIRQGFLRDIGCQPNDIAYFEKVPDWRFQTTTPNASTHYFYSAYSTKDGPVVLEVPPAEGAGMYGQICDMWDVPLALVGPGGEDRGKGGKYLFLPPGYDGAIATDHTVVRQQTYGGFWLIRSIPVSASQNDLDAAIALIKRFRIYPLSEASSPPEQRYVNASGKLWDGIPRMDESFYTVLAKMVNEEPVLPRDLAMMTMLRSVGIEKGRQFAPDEGVKSALGAAIKEAQASMIDTLSGDLPPYWEGARWALPDAAGMKTLFSFQTPEMLDYDARGMLNYFAWAPPMKQDENAPSIYLQTLWDRDGQSLVGDHGYRLRVPPNVPAKQYWSLTLYDLETGGFFREALVISLDSYNELTMRNPDGSIDIYLAPDAPAGQEHNWVTTYRGRAILSCFRLYGPEKAFFDKSWQLPDFERTD